MFWKREKSPLESDVVPSEPRQLDPETAAIDALAGVLRTLGHQSFDLDERSRGDIEESFERWALRLLLGDVQRVSDSSSPSSRGDVSSSRAPNSGAPQRDFGGLRRFVEGHRREEREYVTAALENLRHAVRVFTQCASNSLRAEKEGDGFVETELDKLDRALATNDHATIRRSAERTALTMRHQLENRRLRQQDQVEELRHALGRLKSELAQAKRSASTDALTQVFNRSALDDHLSLVADQAFLSATPACVVMIDIDHFKTINDNFGHPVGDEVLRQVADTIVRGFLRREDFVARYGGEEFCVVAEQTSFEVTRERAERLRRAIEDSKIEAFGKRIRVSVSFGIAALDPGESAKRWLTRADEALYRAKRKGRNRISVAPPGMDDSSDEFPRSSLEEEGNDAEPQRLLLAPALGRV